MQSRGCSSDDSAVYVGPSGLFQGNESTLGLGFGPVEQGSPPTSRRAHYSLRDMPGLFVGNESIPEPAPRPVGQGSLPSRIDTLLLQLNIESPENLLSQLVERMHYRSKVGTIMTVLEILVLKCSSFQEAFIKKEYQKIKGIYSEVEESEICKRVFGIKYKHRKLEYMTLYLQVYEYFSRMFAATFLQYPGHEKFLLYCLSKNNDSLVLKTMLCIEVLAEFKCYAIEESDKKKCLDLTEIVPMLLSMGRGHRNESIQVRIAALWVLGKVTSYGYPPPEYNYKRSMIKTKLIKEDDYSILSELIGEEDLIDGLRKEKILGNSLVEQFKKKGWYQED